MSMDIQAKLVGLLSLAAENEVVEFKEAKNGVSGKSGAPLLA